MLLLATIEIHILDAPHTVHERRQENTALSGLNVHTEVA